MYLYPAMPFDAFTEITEDDLKALWAYFRSLTPVKQRNRENELTFPFSIREGMLAWRLLYFRERFFQPNPGKSAQWNRGAYLVVERPSADGASCPWTPEQVAQLLAIDGVAGLWTFAANTELRTDRFDPVHYHAAVCYLDGDPVAAAEPIGELVRMPCLRPSERPTTPSTRLPAWKGCGLRHGDPNIT